MTSDEEYRILPYCFIDHIRDGFVCFDSNDGKSLPADYVYVGVNKSFELMTGLMQKDVIGRTISEVNPNLFLMGLDLIHICTKAVQLEENEEFILYSDKQNRWYSINVNNDSSGYLSIVFRDITEAKAKEEEIKYLVYHDKLTGLYNRAYFELELGRLDDEGCLPIGLILGDANGLKMINDTFGITQGDKMLKNIGEIFSSVCKEHQTIARIGGDEFGLILPGANSKVASDIINGIKERCNIDTFEHIKPSITFGYAVKDKKSQDIREIYKKAEDRMYSNKLIESRSLRSSIIVSLKKTLEERAYETEAHGLRMKVLSLELGRFMGLYDNELSELSLLAVLHDIGKIAIPDYILGKPDRLTEKEWKIMKEHCKIGYRIASASPELEPIANLILSHHERWDGNGYPKQLKGEEIPLLSRIISVIDAYDAMVNDRPYHRAISSREALKEIKRCAGTQFDPEIVNKFVCLLTSSGQ